MDSDKKVFGIFQLGPVQEFIATSRKTSDLWAGSYLLSFLVKNAMEHVKNRGGKIIYPYSDSIVSPTIESNIPNRFVAEFDESVAKEILKGAEEIIKGKFKEIQESIKNSLLKNINVTDGAIIDNLFQKQCEDFWEIYWIVSNEDQENYSASYTRAEAVFNGRKSIRNFKQIGEEGFKCTLCGKRTPLYNEKDAWKSRNKLKLFWEELRSKYKYRFKENEQLCSICLTKRLLDLNSEFSKASKIPSTASIAISPWLNKLFKAYNEKKLSGDLLTYLKNEINSVSGIINESVKGGTLRRLDEILSKQDNEILKEVFAVEGSYYIIDTYQNIDAPEDMVKRILEKLGSIYKIIESPPKYYAVIRYDGDHIGKYIRSLNSVDEHKEFSKTIYNFSNEVLNLESKFMAKVIYAGGDEGLIFAALEDLPAIIEELRKLFTSKVGKGITISIGVTIAHYSQALQQVLENTKVILKKVKDSGRNATGISVLKRSGEPLNFIIHFDRLRDPFVFFKEMLGCYRNDYISNGWWRDLVDKKFCFIEKPEDKLDKEMLNLEAKRLLLRRYDKEKMGLAQIEQVESSLEDFILRYLFVKPGEDEFDAFVNFIATIEFIAREE
ncbi:MAG: type III-B CRISPR-associated protein Cas10/Cmr2 [Caldisericum sp.]|uniref:type III-B CRISPR-associated protein Cas10/Cmr2 n=1 Tax=Caldisericum sp. TaxID=2499687 RepID=UPI003D120B06